MSDEVYRRLQQRLDTHPVGFPASVDGADIELLKLIYSPAQAELVSRLDWRFQTTTEIMGGVSDLTGSREELTSMLNGIFEQGGISYRRRDEDMWALAPFVVGIYEFQVGRLTPELIEAVDNYWKSEKTSQDRSPSLKQMRVIPIKESVTPDLHVARFEDIEEIVEAAGESIALLECICRKKSKMKGHTCERTERSESCMAFLDWAEHSIKQGTGRRVTPEEARESLRQSQREGLVLMPSNSKEAQFVCSCCPDCCGVLRGLRLSPIPAKATVSNYRASVDAETCTACGVCAEMCPMEAIKIDTSSAEIDLRRCIGCGVCVAQCQTGSITLVRKPFVLTPPDTLDDLYAQYGTSK